MTYDFLQHYWWFIIALLGSILVFLLFVQGANSMIFQLGKTEEDRRILINSTGRKWEFTFTTLVTFGGAFFASFPLFYSTSFGGAYWVWLLILFTFIIQAISYEFQNKAGNIFGVRTFQTCLIINGLLGPLLLGGAVATFFTGSNFIVEKGNITDSLQPVISHWANASRGLDVLLNPWVVVFGIAVVFLARILGTLYINNNVDDAIIRGRVRKQLLINTVLFLVFFLPFLIVTLIGEGYAVNEVSEQPDCHVATGCCAPCGCSSVAFRHHQDHCFTSLHTWYMASRNRCCTGCACPFPHRRMEQYGLLSVNCRPTEFTNDSEQLLK